MKLLILTPVALVIASALLACSSSSSSDSGTPPTDDAGTTPDSSTDSSTSPDSSSTPDSSTSPDSSTTSDAGTLAFRADIYGAIIEHHCVGCHGFASDGGAGIGITYGQLDLSSVDAGYANFVNVEAAGVACGNTDGAPSPIRVVPGSAATSLLYEKVNGYTTAPPCGEAMPKSGEIADGGQAVVVEQIQTWINQGALP